MKMPTVDGRVAWLFAEDNFDIDRIIGVENISNTDIDALGALAMKPFEADFRQQVHPGDVIVGGRNFGYGHPHFTPMWAMRHLGIAGVLAESFAPGFWHTEISAGFPLVRVPGIAQAVRRWDRIAVDWDGARVRLEASGHTLPFEPPALADRQMLLHGGVTGYLRARQSGARG